VTLQVLAQMTNNVISWANDLVSYEKESKRGDVHNLVLVLAHEERLTLHTAVQRVAALHDAEVHAFITLSKSLPTLSPTIDAELDRYVTGMRCWMRGNLDWSLSAARYHLPAVQSDAA
jgi:5-epi-alpha-selinene synthase